MRDKMWVNMLKPLRMFRMNWSVCVPKLGRWNSVVANKNIDTTTLYAGDLKSNEMWEMYVDMANYDNCCCSSQKKSIMVHKAKCDALVKINKVNT